jgi:hypothetical protein
VGFLDRFRESHSDVEEYAASLKRLAESAADQEELLPQVRAAAASTGLDGRPLQRRNEEAFTRYADDILRDDVLTVHEYVMLATVAKGLELEMPRDVEHRALIAAVNGGLLSPLQDVHVLTHAGEDAYFETQAALMKEVVLRETCSAHSGVSVRVVPGVHISTGGTRAHTVVTGKRLEAEDEGILSVTSRRTVFLGNRKTLEFPHAKLLNLTVFSDGLQFHVSGRTSAPLRAGFDGELLAAYVNQAAQRVVAREATGEDDEAVLAEIGKEFDRRIQAQVSGGPTLDFEAFVAEESRRTGRPPETVRDFLGQLAERRAAELEAELDEP